MRLARAWVRTGRRVILADLDFLNPGLHDLLEVPNEEGVADHFAFGTSLAQLARPVDQGAWSLVPTGPWGADAAAVLRSPGWSRLLRELAESDGTLLALASSRAPDVAALAEQFGAVLLLGNVPELPGIRPFSVLAAFRLPGQEEAAEESAAPAAIAPENETAAALVAEPDASVPAGRASADDAFERIRLPPDAR
ncbi:MAG: CpsD/CapB family tyrosine-protein kinase, partial [Gemmatimonadetes bacterium]|nr:CpsD/CapB family tyrosine-protein kinase [Gemmatimonadota bacterium]